MVNQAMECGDRLISNTYCYLCSSYFVTVSRYQFSFKRAGFEMNRSYQVAVNSHRGNGGGGHFTGGAGINRNELPKRLITSTDKDLRYYILKSLESQKIIKPKALNNWKIIPEEWISKAKKREYRLLFGS